MISTDDLRFFLTLAASRSLAAAAHALNATPPPDTPISVFKGQVEYNPRLGRAALSDLAAVAVRNLEHAGGADIGIFEFLVRGSSRSVKTDISTFLTYKSHEQRTDLTRSWPMLGAKSKNGHDLRAILETTKDAGFRPRWRRASP
jgi:hypothetical protein